jgi:hypothetical protein
MAVHKFPSKPCPKCGKSIHARSKSHEECGWVDTSTSKTKLGPKAAAKSAGKQMSKMDAVREALRKEGDDTKPMEIKSYIKKNFNITMDPTVISSYKTSILSKERKKGGRKAGGRALIATGRAANSHHISIEDIRSVKDLADRIGIDRLRQLAEVLAK